MDLYMTELTYDRSLFSKSPFLNKCAGSYLGMDIRRFCFSILIITSACGLSKF